MYPTLKHYWSNVLPAVMVTERFLESVVLLKHALNWDYVDLAHLKLNSRNEATKTK